MHMVSIEVYNVHTEIDTIIVPQLRDDTISQGMQEDFVKNPPPFFADSVRITFDGSISITHYRKEVQTASRNILDGDNWAGGKVEKKDYEFQYLLTDADYQEALENQ